MKKLDSNTIIIGIGNNGRQDDGLGWAFMDDLKSSCPQCRWEYRYQLQIEDAELISKYNQVIFIDATKEHTKEGFYFRTCKPHKTYNFSTHALSAETIIYLAKELYAKEIDAHILAIEGYLWELEIGLSDKATQNLNQAIKYFKDRVLQPIPIEF